VILRSWWRQLLWLEGGVKVKTVNGTNHALPQPPEAGLMRTPAAASHSATTTARVWRRLPLTPPRAAKGLRLGAVLATQAGKEAHEVRYQAPLLILSYTP
jgi:hypothetical protein